MNYEEYQRTRRSLDSLSGTLSQLESLIGELTARGHQDQARSLLDDYRQAATAVRKHETKLHTYLQDNPGASFTPWSRGSKFFDVEQEGGTYIECYSRAQAQVWKAFNEALNGTGTRFILVSGAAQSGKSIIMARCIWEAMLRKQGQRFWIAGDSYDKVRDNISRKLWQTRLWSEVSPKQKKWNAADGFGAKSPKLLVKRKGWKSATDAVFKCLGPDTLIDNPYGEPRKVSEIDSPHWVYSWDESENRVEICKAQKPYIKGYGMIYRVTLSNGQTFDCSAGHQILIHGDQNDEYCCFDRFPEFSHILQETTVSVDDDFSHVQTSDDQHLTQTAEGFRFCCRPFCHSDGERPHLFSMVCQGDLTSHIDAHRHTAFQHRVLPLDDQDNRFGHIQNRCDSGTFRLSNCCEVLQTLSPSEVGRPTFSAFSELLHDCSRLHQPSVELSYHDQPIAEPAVCQNDICSQTFLKSPYEEDGVVFIYDIKPIGVLPIYDFGVERNHNYVTAGVIHHNSYASGSVEFESGTVHGIFLDEPPEIDILHACYSRVARQSGVIFIAATFIDLDETWEHIQENSLENGGDWRVLHMAFLDNPVQTQEEFDRQFAALPEAERSARLLGHPVPRAGRLVPEFVKRPPFFVHDSRDERSVVPPREKLRLIDAIDYHSGKDIHYLLCGVDSKGKVYALDELRHGGDLKTFARKVWNLRLGRVLNDREWTRLETTKFNLDYREQQLRPQFTLFNTHVKRMHGAVGSVNIERFLREHGINTRDHKSDPAQRARILREAVIGVYVPGLGRHAGKGTPRKPDPQFVVTDRCQGLAKQLITCIWDRNVSKAAQRRQGEHRDRPVARDNDFFDCAGMIVESAPSRFQGQKQKRVGRKASSRKMDAINTRRSKERTGRRVAL